MGQTVSRTDFEWVATDEPHATRRRLILDKHPEIKQLMGPDWRHKYIVTAMVLFQFVCVYLVWLCDPSWPVTIFLSYVLGGTVNHSLMLANHETAHNLPFGNAYPLVNRLFGIFENLPLGIPMSVSFKKYHLDHHRYQGDEVLDVDIPSRFETKFFYNSLTKLLWLFLQPAFYALRPFFINPKPMSQLELFNFTLQLSFDAYLFYGCSPKCLFYFLGGSLLSMGVHPLAGHFVAEHYLFDDEKQETHSYYGPLNWLTWNVGYHVEHHDFPYISSWRLADVKRIAPEFYDHLEHHTSWVKVLYRFVVDPRVGPYSRVKRRTILNSQLKRHPLLLNSHGAPMLMRTADCQESDQSDSDSAAGETKLHNGNGNGVKNGKGNGVGNGNGNMHISEQNGNGKHAKVA